MNRNKQLGFGIVGCGMIADFHARAIKAMKGVRLVCAYDVDANRARRIAGTYNCKAFFDYDDFLACPGLDIVTIATPSGAHLDSVVKAAKTHKHIICEKPLEITLERIDKMIRVCKENRVTLSGIFPRRFNQATIEFKKAADAGRFGRITMADAYIKWYRTQEYYDSGGWRGTWKLDGGGALMNQAIHTIDLLIYLAGDVKSVCAWAGRSIHKRIEVEDIAVAIVNFKNGALGVIEGSTACYSPTGHPAEVQICGSDGSVFMKDNSFTKWEFRKILPLDTKIMEKLGSASAAKGAGAADPKAIDFRCHQSNFEDAVKAIKSGKKPAIGGSETRKSVELILAIYKSALSGGKKVDLPLKHTPVLKSFR